MNYKFDLDHMLAIANIHEMITIDIKPETTSIALETDVKIHGYLKFNGSYLTPTLDEEGFDGQIPIDITLPLLPTSASIDPEISKFDYLVKKGESLTLKIEITLKGYPVDEAAAWFQPVNEEIAYQQAVIEPFTTASLSQQASASLTEATSEALGAEFFEISDNHDELEKQVTIASDCQATTLAMTADFDEQFATIAKLNDATTSKVVDEPVFYSPLVDIVEEELAINQIELADLNSVVARQELVELDASLSQFVELEIAQPEMPQQVLGQASANQELKTAPDTSATTPEALSASEASSPVALVDSVARQFFDGEITIKMVYVDHQSQTLDDILGRYSATLNDVWNLPSVTKGITVGDCVMLRYEK